MAWVARAWWLEEEFIDLRPWGNIRNMALPVKNQPASCHPLMNLFSIKNLQCYNQCLLTAHANFFSQKGRSPLQALQLK